LLERETLTRDDILLLKAGKELPPRLPPDVPLAPQALAIPAVPVARPVAPPLLGGPEIAPA
jgi:cell division protease FtsH